MKIATWNVNSLSVRLPQVLDWLAANPVDVLGLQELKLTDDKFPHEALVQAGYQAVSFGQKTYNGVALLATYHPAFLLRSPGMKARAWDAVSPLAICTGAVLKPSLRAASRRVCPARTTIASSTTMGWRQPNSWIEAATVAMACALRRGLRA